MLVLHFSALFGFNSITSCETLCFFTLGSFGLVVYKDFVGDILRCCDCISLLKFGVIVL
jgi:hypothetical protein